MTGNVPLNTTAAIHRVAPGGDGVLRVPARVYAMMHSVVALVGVGLAVLNGYVFFSANASEKDRYLALPVSAFIVAALLFMVWWMTHLEIEIADGEITYRAFYRPKPMRMHIDEVVKIDYNGEPIRATYISAHGVVAGAIKVVVLVFSKIALRYLSPRSRNGLLPAEAGGLTLWGSDGKQHKILGATTQLDAIASAILEYLGTRRTLTPEMETMVAEIRERNRAWTQRRSMFRRFGLTLSIGALAIGVLALILLPKPESDEQKMERLREVVAQSAADTFGQQPTSVTFLDPSCTLLAHYWYDGTSSNSSQCEFELEFPEPLPIGVAALSKHYLVRLDPPRIIKDCINELCGDPTAPPELLADFAND